MAITSQILDFFLQSIGSHFDSIDGLRMVELGDQLMDASVPEGTAKEFFVNQGVSHVSLDLNGAHGAQPVDLSKLIEDPSLVGQFDVVTNAGTLEHVEPLESQVTAFINVHNLVRPGGIVLHVLPDVESLEVRGIGLGHCNNYYSRSFFETLTSLFPQELISCELAPCGNWNAHLRKLGDSLPDFPPFPHSELLYHITRKSGGLVYPGINNV